MPCSNSMGFKMPRKLGEPLMAAGDCSELAALVELSAYLGKQKLLVQASTGNTSIKIGRTLWIKAAGKWLANAADERMFVPVDCAETGRYLSGELPGSTHSSGLKQYRDGHAPGNPAPRGNSCPLH